MLKIIDISIITNTWNRHKQLIQCIEFVKQQKCNIDYEHIVVSDGHDAEVLEICNFFKITSKCIKRDDKQDASNGHYAKDVGISMAKGKYIVFWDDDNFYYNDALLNLYESSKGHDIGICKIIYYKKHREENESAFFEIPIKWNGKFILGDIDTMNVCVSAKLAKKFNWSDSKLYEGDYVWLNNICKENKIDINFSNKIIGLKL